MARKKHDEHAAPEIRNDVDCRAAKPKFQNGVWTPAKISDTTGGGLYLLVKPDPDKPIDSTTTHDPFHRHKP